MIDFKKTDNLADTDDLIDALMDLKHDLGKYIYIPFAMLPADASDGQVLKAIENSLVFTRKSKNGIRDAKEIWMSFLGEAKDMAQNYKSFDNLKFCVEKALENYAFLNKKTPIIDLEQLKSEMSAVSINIQKLIEEVLSGGTQA